MASPEHWHELDGEWYGHRHDGGDRPHRHEHTPAEAEAHEDAVEDGGACPVCGEVHELSEDERDEAEAHEDEGEKPDEKPDEAHEDEKHEEHEGEKGDEDEDEGEDEGEKDDEDEEPEAVHAGPPQAEEPERRRRGPIVTSAWHAHRSAR